MKALRSATDPKRTSEKRSRVGSEMRLILTIASMVAFTCFTSQVAAVEPRVPPALSGGYVRLRAEPAAPAHGGVHIAGEIDNQSKQGWLAIHFECHTDNERTDGLPSYHFALVLRFPAGLPPGARETFQVLPETEGDRRHFKDAVKRYPQPYWWICGGSNVTGEDTHHQTYSVAPQAPPNPPVF